MSRALGSVAKIAPPRLASTFSRPRLFRLLDRARKQPIVWISAPAGFGKTTLVASYLAARTLLCLWYQMDLGDADPAAFFSYLGLAARRAAPRKRRPFPLLTPEYLPGLPIFTRRYFENLYDRLRPPSVLVFDNYHDVPADSPVHEIIALALAQLPEGICAFVVSRAPPPPAFARLEASGAIAHLGADALALNGAEALALARLRGDAEMLPRPAVERLHALTHGWAAGLVLLLARAARGHVPPAYLAEHPGEAVFDYFAREVLEGVDTQTQDFLLRTAFLPRLSADAAERLTGRPDSERLLSELARGNYFTTRHVSPDGPDQYRYHDLFRDFLLTRARERFDAAALAAIERVAAAALVASDEVAEAVPLLRSAAAWDDLAKLILAQAPRLLERGQHRTVAGWLEALPEQVRSANGWLMFWLGVARLPFDPDGSRSNLERAFALFRAEGDVSGQMLAWSSIVDTITDGGADLPPLNDWIAVAEKELVPRYPVLPEGMIKNRFTSAMFSARLWQHLRHPDLAAWAGRALPLLERGEDPQQRALVGLSLALYSWYGDAGCGDALLDLLRPLASSTAATPFALICCRVSQAVLHQHANRLAESLQAVEDGLRRARESGVIVWNFFLHMLGAYDHLIAGDVAKAQTYLAAAEPLLSPKRPMDRTHFQMTSAWLALEQGDAPRARALAEHVRRVAEERGTVMQQALSLTMLAQACRACGERTESASLATRALQLARQTPFEETARMAHLLLADFALSDGDEATGLAHLRAALEIAHRNRSVNCPYVTRGQLLGRLYAHALQSGIEVEYTRELVRAHRRILPTPPAYLDDWPWPVRISTLGGLSLSREGRPIGFKGKVPHKPLELLKALVALGGRDVREQRLSELLWPDAEGDAAHSTLKTTLSRLRQLIGDEAIVVQHGHIGLSPRVCWVDTWALEELLAQAANRGPARADAERLGDKALALYRGPFLGDEEAPWALPLRERLRAKVLHYLGQWARQLEQDGRHEAAVALFHRGLEVDELAEDLYCGLLKAHLALGRHAEARAVCERCRKTLQSVAGVEPSPETQALCRSLHLPTAAGPAPGRSVTDS
jgi:LuxR family maltose regulon positive regulatory protein